MRENRDEKREPGADDFDSAAGRRALSHGERAKHRERREYLPEREEIQEVEAAQVETGDTPATCGFVRFYSFRLHVVGEVFTRCRNLYLKTVGSHNFTAAVIIT